MFRAFYRSSHMCCLGIIIEDLAYRCDLTSELIATSRLQFKTNILTYTDVRKIFLEH